MAENPQNQIQWGERTYIMGILNLTPDSFSGDGLKGGGDVVEKALQQAVQFINQGADILDIGGESTRPGSEPVSAEEEIARVLPLVERLSDQFPGMLLSIDTYKAEVARAALGAGVDWVNDIWGLNGDPGMADVVAEFNVPVVIMHNRSKPGTAQLEARLGGRYVGAEYSDLIGEICTELMASVALAHVHGIRDENIILDPGIGFGKTVDQNLELVERLREIKALGYPLLIGPSRKSFIGYTLDLPPEERLEGTAAVVALCIERGADIIRVHDVKAMTRVARMTDAIIRRGNPK